MSDLLQPKNILIVDDNCEFIKSFKGLIQAMSGNCNTNIEYAQTGLEALNKIKQTNYQLIFMDINLPDMDGVVLTRFIDFGLNNQSLNIVAISFYSDEYYRTRMLRAGAKAYLSKGDIDAELLADILSTYVYC